MTHDKARFKALLEDKRKELVRSIRSMSEELIIGDSEHDVIDQVQSMGNREQAITIVDAMSRAVSDIDAALRAIDDGLYGICVECDEPIAPKRLQTIPWASHCIRCQEALENRDHQFEGHSYWRDAA
jgi:DnaK suppressor protein